MPPPLHPVHTLCPVCQHRIVTATLPDGRPVALDTGLRTYRLVLAPDNRTYKAEASSGYPVHACPGKEESWSPSPDRSRLLKGN